MLKFEDIINKAREIHGDKYDYLEDSYVNMHTKMKIYCHKHGWFEQTPSKHIHSRQGCPKCRGMYKTTEEWVRLAMNVHGNKYDYSETVYGGSHKKVYIICSKHGGFWQIAKDHLAGEGCPKCKFEKISLLKKSNNEQFIEKARQIWGDRFDYSKVIYEKSNKKVCVICPIHGEFWITPNSHLRGCGCPKCVGKNKTTDEIIQEFCKVHGDKYDYSKVKYIDAKTKVCIICHEHGEFWQLPYAHLVMRQGCPKCSMSHMENKIDRLLTENNIEHFYNTNINGLLKRQSVDFYIPEYNTAIECQGGQHFYPGFNRNDIKKAIQIHNNARVRDIKKNQKCKDNDIKLIYFTDIIDLPSDVFINKKYQGIYNETNLITDVEKLIQKIKDEV
jgi:hypothetical protein